MKKANPKYPKAEDWFTEEQKEFVLSKLFDQLEFFGYFRKNDEEGKETNRYAMFDEPKMLGQLRDKYKKYIVDPTGGKTPLINREYELSNYQVIKSNAKY
tara:strand:- start:186 stop:485 length:300 start_codon:yes stop_codon:yes gene_type:complete